MTASLMGPAHEENEWKAANGYVKEERPVQQVRKLLVKGAVDVVFITGSKPQMVVAGENRDVVSSVKTYVEGDKLVVEQEGITIQGGGGRIQVSGSGNIVAGGSIHVGGRGKVSMSFGGSTANVVVASGGCLVGLALPEAPTVGIQGSGDVVLYGLNQQTLEISIQGSGDVTALGRVDDLEVEIAGSGDVDASDLVAAAARLSIAGSGGIDAHVTRSVKARIAGSGDIVVRGNPAARDHSVAGTGKVKFKG
ncbi:TPA: GIN domain-containing protein [Pseudomonas aeruginosa]